MFEEKVATNATNKELIGLMGALPCNLRIISSIIDQRSYQLNIERRDIKITDTNIASQVFVTAFGKTSPSFYKHDSEDSTRELHNFFNDYGSTLSSLLFQTKIFKLADKISKFGYDQKQSGGNHGAKLPNGMTLDISGSGEGVRVSISVADPNSLMKEIAFYPNYYQKNSGLKSGLLILDLSRKLDINNEFEKQIQQLTSDCDSVLKQPIEEVLNPTYQEAIEVEQLRSIEAAAAAAEAAAAEAAAEAAAILSDGGIQSAVDREPHVEAPLKLDDLALDSDTSTAINGNDDKDQQSTADMISAMTDLTGYDSSASIASQDSDADARPSEKPSPPAQPSGSVSQSGERKRRVLPPTPVAKSSAARDGKS